MAKTQAVQAPDGREWTVRSYRFRFPRFFAVGSSSSGSFLARLVVVLVFGLVFWLVAVLLKLLVHPFRRAAWVDATSVKPEAKVLLWRTKRGREEAVAAEVAEALRAGTPPQPQGAEERKP
jgi:hypothetical protein